MKIDVDLQEIAANNPAVDADELQRLRDIQKLPEHAGRRAKGGLSCVFCTRRPSAQASPAC
jgi:hypothetical protein